MSSLRLILVSLIHHWRTNCAVALGVAAAAAVITGGLLVGDSMRGSLRRLTLDRLADGKIEEVLLAGRFFREELADELAAEEDFKQRFDAAVPAIVLRANMETAGNGEKRRANRINLIGCDARFWQMAGGEKHELTRRQIILNQSLANALGIGEVRPTEEEDAEPIEVLLYLGNQDPVPAESLLGKEDERPEFLRLELKQTIPADGLGRFSMRPSQQTPLNAYVSLSALQRSLLRQGSIAEEARVNALLVTAKTPEQDPPKENHEALQGLLRPALADYGIVVELTERGYFNVTSDRMLIERPAEDEIRRVLDEQQLAFQPALTYLANRIDVRPEGKGGIPYSTITAVDFTADPPLGPFVSAAGDRLGPLRDGDDARRIVLNQWAADDLRAKPGDTVYVDFFEPESTHGEAKERTEAFRLAAIVALADAAADPGFTPKLAGVTDVESLGDWEAPFRGFDRSRLRLQEPDGSVGPDEQYWDDHGPTPKAFLSLSAGRELFGSRFGRTTSIRVEPTEDVAAVEQLEARLRLDPQAMGLVFRPLKRLGLEASAGATDFDVLFLSLSFFIIAAAVMLVMLLFRLGVEQRARELGTLVAVGFTRRRVAGLLAGEGLAVATFGSLLGVPAGVGYAAVMLWGLQSDAMWLDAVVTPFLQLHARPISLAIGFAAGVVVAELAIVWIVWRTRRIPPRQLLAGRTHETAVAFAAPPRWADVLGIGLLLGAIGFGVWATFDEAVRAAAFFGAGAMVLAGCLTLLWGRLRSGTSASAVTAGRGNLLRMALRNASRNPGRSTLTVGLIAAASFLIVAVSAFRLDPSRQTPKLESGNGGFALVGETDQPFYEDLDALPGVDLPEGTRTFALRVNEGDDASCLNLYRPAQPRVLGIPGAMIARGGFAWAGVDADTPEQRDNPWLLLERELPNDDDDTPLVPVVLEKNTAVYSLRLGFNPLGATYEIDDARGRPIRLKVVGLLTGSILQGDLLMSEEALLDHFPEVSGHRFFLIETPPETAADVQRTLQSELSDFGFTAETSGRRLDRFMAVQNTYLLTFQSLGGLGLLLGTFGLAAVQLRNVLLRRGELALLRAAGFRRSLLATMVMLENALLLIAGLGCGLAAATVAVLPHWLAGGASAPTAPLAATLALVLAAGLIAGLIAVRATLAAPLLSALREER